MYTKYIYMICLGTVAKCGLSIHISHVIIIIISHDIYIYIIFRMASYVWDWVFGAC